MIIIVLLFTVCWAPFHTVHMLFEYCKYPQKSQSSPRVPSFRPSVHPKALNVDLLRLDDLEKKYDDVTLNMTVAVVQAVGFFNSFNNPIVYAFMNENFKKSCVSALSRCTRRPGRRDEVQAPPVRFIKLQTREAFLELGDGAKRRGADGGPSDSSRGESSPGEVGEKRSTIQTELAANSDSQGK